MEIKSINKNVYKKFAYNHKYASFLHSVEMEKVSALKNWNTEYLGIYDNDLVGVIRLLSFTNRVGKKIYYAVRGPIMDYSNLDFVKEVLTTLKVYLKNNNGYLFKIDPEVPYEEHDIDGNVVEGGYNNKELVPLLKKMKFSHLGFNTYYIPTSQNRWHFKTDLKGKTVEEVFNSLRSSHRNKINKTKNFGISVEEISYDDLALYKEITEDTASRRGFSDRDLDYYQTLYKAYEKSGNCKFLIAYLNPQKYRKTLKEQIVSSEEEYNKKLNSKASEGAINEAKKSLDSLKTRLEEIKDLKGTKVPLGASLFIIHGNTVNYIAGGSYKEYMNFYVQYALQWYMIEYAINNKLEVFNFLGITGNFDKNDPEYGVYDFKKGFGGKVFEYIGEFQLPLSSYYYIVEVKNLLKKIIHK